MAQYDSACWAGAAKRLLEVFHTPQAVYEANENELALWKALTKERSNHFYIIDLWIGRNRYWMKQLELLQTC